MSLRSLEMHRMISRLPLISYGSPVILLRHDSNSLFRNLSSGFRTLTTLPSSSRPIFNCGGNSAIWRDFRLPCTPPPPQLLCSLFSSLQNSRKFHTSSAGLSPSSSGGDDDSVQSQGSLPPLMVFPPVIWPKFMNALRNWFFIHFIIKPYFDKEFSMQEFLVGAKEAVAIVANKLSEGKLDDLEGLVDPTALAQIKESLSKFTVFQQQLLRVAVEDIFFAFPYQIGIIIPDEGPREELPEGVKPPPQTRHVEITVSLHVLRGIAEKHKSSTEFGATPFNFQEFAQEDKNKTNFMVCNYRFFRDFTEGSDPSWIINMVNHFLPMELSPHQKLR